MSVYIIAEAACTWLHGGPAAARRSIEAAKSCGASAWKTQWTSDPAAMHERRKIPGDHYKRLAWDPSRLPLLKAHCDTVGIDFMCTVYLPKDVDAIAPYVDHFKVSAFESGDVDLIHQCVLRRREKKLYVSINRGKPMSLERGVGYLLCVSAYPTKLEDLQLSLLRSMPSGVGLSDHTTSTLTGAVAVGAGARVLEKHTKLWDTPDSDPDYGHSLYLDSDGEGGSFREYVRNVREAERML